MGNNLNESIEGRFVMLAVDFFRESLRKKVEEHPEERVFLAEGGFGCSPDTMGNAVIGEFVVDGERCRVEGYELDRFATSNEVAAAFAARDARHLAGTERMLLALASFPNEDA